MLSYKDCVDLCDMTQDEIAAVAEHEHIPDIIAIGLAEYLLHTPDGVPMLKRIILDDIEVAISHGNREGETHLRAVLKHFVQTHPEHAPVSDTR